MQNGPCINCGATNYSLSVGGPNICPACDCGYPPEASRAIRALERKQVELIHEEAAHSKTLRDLEYAQKMLDDMTYALQDLTGEYFGEHSSEDNPWELALDHLQDMADEHHKASGQSKGKESAQ